MAVTIPGRESAKHSGNVAVEQKDQNTHTHTHPPFVRDTREVTCELQTSV